MDPDEELDELSPETRERMERFGIELVPCPRVWFRCESCGAVWQPHVRVGADIPAWLCPNGCNEGQRKR